MAHPAHPNRSRAFSFAEIMVGVGIMAIAILPVLGLFSSSHSGTKVTVQRAMARNLASDVLEFVRGAPYDLVDESVLNGDLESSSSMPPVPVGFTRTSKVTETPFDPPAFDSPGVMKFKMKFDYKTIVTEVKYRDSGQEKSIKLTTIVIKK